MRHENSYKENMKYSAIQKQKKVDRFFLDMYSQMVIDEAIFKAKKQDLLLKIDDSLDRKDPSSFYQLSAEYLKLLKDNRATAHSL